MHRHAHLVGQATKTTQKLKLETQHKQNAIWFSANKTLLDVFVDLHDVSLAVSGYAASKAKNVH